MHTRTVIRSVLMMLIAASVMLFTVRIIRADAVTDTIAVRVGYSGMELSEYVEIGNYHWSELANNLPVVQRVYSYYNGGNDNGTEFNAIVDSANGVLLRDFLEYAHVYYGDIYNLMFYVQDHQDIQAAFDRDSLFQPRYYFEDYNGHLYREYDENFNVIAVDSSDCWNYCDSVEPMLALEDNWVSFSQEFEHALPDFANVSTTNRFRLLFGQTWPEESLTSSSAKYVCAIYVTLAGSPEFGEPPELDKQLGSHETTMQVSVKSDMRYMLSEFMQLGSTDENVLVITGIRMEPDSFYEDLVNVVISYDIVGKGNASITASFSGSGETIATAATVDTTDIEEPTEPTPPTEPQKTEDDTNTDSPAPADSSSTPSQTGSGTVNPGNKPADTTQKPASSGTTAELNSAQTIPPEAAVLSADEIEAIKDNPDKLSAGSLKAFRLSKDVADSLNARVAVSDPLTPAAADIEQVKIEDRSEEKSRMEQRILICTGAGAAGIAVLGGLAERLVFAHRLKRPALKRAAVK